MQVLGGAGVSLAGLRPAQVTKPAGKMPAPQRIARRAQNMIPYEIENP
jgi:hypothetical protein